MFCQYLKKSFPNLSHIDIFFEVAYTLTIIECFKLYLIKSKKNGKRKN